MKEDFSHLNEKDQLRAENDFMKMKLMLEKGASFGEGDNKGLSPEIENRFLKNVIEFEKQFDEHKMIKVFDKIGKPSQFKPVVEIADDKMDEAWTELKNYMKQYGISLDVCSPNISNKELYRFSLEELFDCEMDDVNIPGMMHCFIYDEFHPDPVYDNTSTAVESCIQHILDKRPMEWTYCFRKDNLKLNEHFPLNIHELMARVNRFKEAYEDLEMKEIEVGKCVVNIRDSHVDGTYKLTATTGAEVLQLAGNWKVFFELDEKMGYWNIIEVQIENINL